MQVMIIPPLKKNVNEDFFTKWSPEMSYVLGYIYADGCISYRKRDKSKRLDIFSKDKEHLEKIKFLMNSQHKVRCYDKIKNCYQITFHHNKLFNSLLEHGVTPRKSLTMKFPNIPNRYLRHFIRGYFDGDGWIGKYKSQKKYNFIQFGFVSGSEMFLKKLKNILQKYNIKMSKIIKYKTKNSKWFTIVGGKEAGQKIFHFFMMIFQKINFLKENIINFLRC